MWETRVRNFSRKLQNCKSQISETVRFHGMFDFTEGMFDFTEGMFDFTFTECSIVKNLRLFFGFIS